MSDEVGSVRFTSYSGRTVYVAAERVLMIEQGSCGSRGVAAHIVFDTGARLTVNEEADSVRRRIDAARHYG